MAVLHPISGHVVADEHAARIVPPSGPQHTGQGGRDPATDDPDSFVEVLPPLDDRDELALERARARLRRLLSTGRYRPLERPALVVTEVEEDGRRTRSLIGDLDVAAFDDGTVLPHEQLSPDRVETLRRHITAVGAVSTPVSLAHPGDGHLEALLTDVSADVPRVRLTDGAGSLALWVVDDPDGCERLARAAATTGPWLLADGHHRAAAARDTGRVLVALSPDEQLWTHPFHRRLGVSRGTSVDEALRTLDLDVTGLVGAAAPRGPGEVTVTADGRWWRASLRVAGDGGAEDDDLDVLRVEHQLLAPLATAVGDGHGVRAVPPHHDPALLTEPGTVTVLLHPPSLAQMRRVAMSGGVLPQKSTYVVPKQRPGLLVVPRTPLPTDRR